MKTFKELALEYCKIFSDEMHGADGVYEYDSMYIDDNSYSKEIESFDYVNKLDDNKKQSIIDNINLRKMIDIDIMKMSWDEITADLRKNKIYTVACIKSVMDYEDYDDIYQILFGCGHAVHYDDKTNLHKINVGMLDTIVREKICNIVKGLYNPVEMAMAF